MDGQVEGYAHDIVERAEQTGAAGAAIVVDEVEGTLAGMAWGRTRVSP